MGNRFKDPLLKKLGNISPNPFAAEQMRELKLTTQRNLANY